MALYVLSFLCFSSVLFLLILIEINKELEEANNYYKAREKEIIGFLKDTNTWIAWIDDRQKAGDKFHFDSTDEFASATTFVKMKELLKQYHIKELIKEEK